jgi:hypothetical protein
MNTIYLSYNNDAIQHIKQYITDLSQIRWILPISSLLHYYLHTSQSPPFALTLVFRHTSVEMILHHLPIAHPQVLIKSSPHRHIIITQLAIVCTRCKKRAICLQR